MPARLVGVLFLAFPLFAVARPDAEPAPDKPMEKLETAIPFGIKLLEAKKHAEFLKAFVEPEQLKKILASKEIDAFAKEFAGEKAATLLGVLKEIQGTKPRMEDEGKKAVYPLKTNVIGKDTVSFRKHGKVWHIEN